LAQAEQNLGSSRNSIMITIQVVQFVGLVLVHSIVPIATIERHEATLDNRGNAYILRREELDDHATKALIGSGDSRSSAQEPGDSKREPGSSVGMTVVHPDPYGGAGVAVQSPETEGQAEAELQKLDEVVRIAEQKAGLPDSTKTTPEPYTSDPSNEDQETFALMIALISLIVLAGTCSAGWSIWVAHAKYSKADGIAGKSLLEDSEDEAYDEVQANMESEAGGAAAPKADYAAAPEAALAEEWRAAPEAKMDSEAGGAAAPKADFAAAPEAAWAEEWRAPEAEIEKAVAGDPAF